MLSSKSKPNKPEPNPTSKRLHFDQAKRKRGGVKHGILKTCLDGWLPCVSSHFCGERGKLLVYVDGFAGAGKHVSSNENGSPLLMCDTVAVHSKLKKNFRQPNKPLVGLLMIFTEKDQKTWQKLKKNVDERLEHHNKGRKIEFIYNYKSETFPEKLEEVHAMFRKWRDSPEYQRSQCPKIYVVVECGEFKDKMNQVLDVYANNPMFIFADPFGWTGMPLELFRRILSNCTPGAPKDMLINFMNGNIRRFIDHEGHQDSLREAIGEIRPPPPGPGTGSGPSPGSSSGSGLHSSGLSPNEKLDHIICEYIRNIKQGYRRNNLMDAKFAMRGKNNGHVYHLIFLCSHIKSLKHMKYSMYRYSDTCKDFQFSEWNKKLHFRDFPQEKQDAACEVFDRVKEHFNGKIVSGEKIDDYICTHIPLHFNFKVELKKLLRTYNVDPSVGRAFNINVYNFNVCQRTETMPQEIVVAETVAINYTSRPVDNNGDIENSRNYASTRIGMDALTTAQRVPRNLKRMTDTLRDADEPAQVRVAMKRRNF